MLPCAGCIGTPETYIDDEGQTVTEVQSCVCGHEEIAIRHLIAGTWPHGPLTPEQRAWLVESADYTAEGALKEEELREMSDCDIARATLGAWNDYVSSQLG